jgi:lipid A 4'-phosphatase
MIFTKLNRRWRELFVLLILTVLTTPFFWFTNLDIEGATWFYQPDNEKNVWPQQQFWVWHILYNYAYSFTLFVAFGALIIAALGCIIPELKQARRPATYILLVIALGPGLVVNLTFKDHWGRPRPVHISEFGGALPYVPPLKMGHTADKAFPCGHCSVGFSFFALYFLLRKRRYLYFTLTIIIGLTLGLTRMSAGGHFISDILWSGYLVFFVAWLIYYGWYTDSTLQDDS